MKLRRRLLMLALAATMLFSMATVAYADSVSSKVDTVRSKSYNMYMTGYINYVSGSLWFKDKAIYQGILNGGSTEMDYFYKPNDNIYIQVYNVKDKNKEVVIKTEHMYGGYRNTKQQTVKFYGDYAKIVIKCYDNAKSIVEKDGSN